MADYDFKSAKRYIQMHSDIIDSASLGMAEDWGWTAETVYENGRFLVDLDECESIAGISGSSWATPTLEIEFKHNDTTEQKPCFVGEVGGQKPEWFKACSGGIVADMLAATFEEGGTAASSKLSVYRLAGKTGTAHKVGGTGYLSDRYRALFAGFAPAGNPEIVGVVVIDEPSQDRYYGGEVAAPVFAQVAQQALPYLGIKPHLPDEGDVAAQIEKAMKPFLTIAKEGV